VGALTGFEPGGPPSDPAADLVDKLPALPGKVGHHRPGPDSPQGDLVHDSETHRKGLEATRIEPVLPE
jgi:hypothetical protein